MKQENKMLFILGTIGICNIIAALILFITINEAMVPMLLIASGILLVIGGYVDKKERTRKAKKKS
ncbi:hypothetical protein LCM20_17355 [Halobacillus litoralis]|uniref:hypothetical protein n=1 Tax=Halobacillus litoralis TaxID=45668 RepID=UPI001CD6A131|nr:hypothetical protein [Halobacillus litoralis]MCA0972377.1 hypothetical protein [Halobacillus litoralis]